MDGIRKLTPDDFAEVRRIFIDCFFDNEYFVELFPDGRSRVEMIDLHIMPVFRFFLERRTSVGFFSGGRLCGYILLVEYDSKGEEIIDRNVFDVFIKLEGSGLTSAFKEAAHRTCAEYGRLVYLFIGAVDSKLRGLGTGKKLVKHCLDTYSDRPEMTELTTPVIMKIFRDLAGNGRMTREKITDFYVITKVMPSEKSVS